MTPSKFLSAIIGAALGLAASLPAQAGDAIAMLNDAELFKNAQKDVAALPRPELDLLSETLAACAATSIGQRPQQFECEKGITLYWMRYGRGRPLDDYLSALGTLYAAFDNNPLNPSGEMMGAYRHASKDTVTLSHSVNERYRQLK
jgi:hypothetical protein